MPVAAVTPAGSRTAAARIPATKATTVVERGRSESLGSHVLLLFRDPSDVVPFVLVDKTRAAAGSFLFLLVAPGVVAGVVPWLLTGWDVREPPYWLPLRVVGGS